MNMETATCISEHANKIADKYIETERLKMLLGELIEAVGCLEVIPVSAETIFDRVTAWHCIRGAIAAARKELYGE